MLLWTADHALVLASKSEARRRILVDAGLPVEIAPASIDERAVEASAGTLVPNAAAVLLARAKAAAVSAQLPGRLVLGADQTLALGERRFSKPKDRADARAQLQMLSGKTHELHSAIAAVRDGKALFEHADTARLTMRALSDEFLHRYLDAAGGAVTASVGGYQIEGAGIHLFERIAGDYFTVLGLPLLPLLDFLRRNGFIAN
jgi:septum formation protein